MKVLVATGSSGGHIAPAVAYLERLRQREPDCRVLLLAPRTDLLSWFVCDETEVALLRHIKIVRSFNRDAVTAAADLLYSFFVSARLLARYKPDLVVGFGTVHSVAPVMLAWLFRVRTVIHEQNVIPGSANRFLAKFADLVCVSFEESKRYFARAPQSLRLTGDPLRSTLTASPRSEALGFFGFEEQRSTVLIMGGSQGSRMLNDYASQAVCRLSRDRPLQVLHITGDEDYQQVQERYAASGVKAKVYVFLKEMRYALSCADLALSRSGATTVHELIRFRLPALLVPYPFAGRHQQANAQVLEKHGCAVIIKEEEASPERILGVLEDIISTPGVRQRLKAGYLKIAHDGAEDALVEATLSL